MRHLLYYIYVYLLYIYYSSIFVYIYKNKNWDCFRKIDEKEMNETEAFLVEKKSLTNEGGIDSVRIMLNKSWKQ